MARRVSFNLNILIPVHGSSLSRIAAASSCFSGGANALTNSSLYYDHPSCIIQNFSSRIHFRNSLKSRSAVSILFGKRLCFLICRVISHMSLEMPNVLSSWRLVLPLAGSSPFGVIVHQVSSSRSPLSIQFVIPQTA